MPQVVADALVHLLRMCPDIVSARKELLVALRSLISNQLKDVLRTKLDVFMADETVLIGAGRACNETQVCARP
jgi:hypothetical protein